MENQKSQEQTPIETLSSKIDSNLQEIEKLMPTDPIASATGAKVGSEEHIHQSELLNIVKNTNSTKRVNRTLKILEILGYVGLLIASVIKFIGIVYDINFHVPFLATVIGTIGVMILGFFIAVVIIILTHIASDGIVNNKWRAFPRLVLVWLAILGLTASFYFDYRAISNYTAMVVDQLKTENLDNTQSTDGVAIQSVDDSSMLLKNSMELYQKSLMQTEERLSSISAMRTTIGESVERVKTAKEGTTSAKEISKLNQNIYTSRKQIEELSKEEEKIHEKQAELRAAIQKIQNQIEAKAKEKGEILQDVDGKMDKDQFDRLIFLFVLVIFIEVTSFGKLLADFLGNKNLEVCLREDMDKLNNNTNAMSVLRNHITSMEVRQARDFDRELSMRGAVTDVYALSSIANMHRQAENIKSLTASTHKIGEATQQVTEMAVEGIANSIRANLATQRVEKLQRLLLEGKNATA